MKFTLSVFILFAHFSLNAQNTTQEEYNYMSKGFARMVSEGMDLKKGYFLSDTIRFTIENNRYLFSFYNLKRVTDKSLAGTIVTVKSGVSGSTYYLGIPAANSNMSIDLKPTLMAQISNYNWDSGIRNAFLLSLAEYLMIINTNKGKLPK